MCKSVSAKDVNVLYATKQYVCVCPYIERVGPNYNGSQQQNKGPHKTISIGTIDPTRKFYGNNTQDPKCIWNQFHKAV